MSRISGFFLPYLECRGQTDRGLLAIYEKCSYNLTRKGQKRRKTMGKWTKDKDTIIGRQIQAVNECVKKYFKIC